jgi:hypothetical protein
MAVQVNSLECIHIMSGSWQNQVNENPLPWLTENDPDNPGVRYFTLKEIYRLDNDHQEINKARRQIMQSGPVPVILAAQDQEGFWVEPGSGYYPKYTGSVWQIITLAKLGADGNDPRISKGCQFILENTRSHYGGFSADQRPSGMIQCLQGNLCAALIELGWMKDERFIAALDWLARSITGEGIEPAENRSAPIRYYRSGNSAPGFRCSANNHLPCAWGAVKAMTALSKVPESEMTDSIKNALESGVNFLLSRNPAQADYPMGYSEKPNRSWFKFGFQTGYVSDVLEILEIFTRLGYAKDARLSPAVDLLLGKQDYQGRWKMEYSYNGKTWVDIESRGETSKWVTFRAIRVLQQVFG